MKDSITIHNWNDMPQLGINALTGESCAFGMRLLCDLNEHGRELIRDWLGLPVDCAFADNWNSQVDNLPAVGSVMLHRDSLPQIVEFAFCRMGALATIACGDGTLIGVFTEDLLKKYEDYVYGKTCDPNVRAWAIRRNVKGAHPAVGSRNVHQFSGRSE